MSAINRAALQALKNTYIISGGRLTTAANLRTLIGALIDSLAAIVDDRNQPGGYMGLDDDGKATLSQIASGTPTGLFLKDNGTYAQILSVVLAGISIEPGDVAEADNILSALGKLQGKLKRTEEVVDDVNPEILAFDSKIANNVAQVMFRLPATPALGDRYKIRGKGAGGWGVEQHPNQIIRSSTGSTTLGATGKIESSNRYDCVELECIVGGSSAEFLITNNTGTLTIT